MRLAPPLAMTAATLLIAACPAHASGGGADAPDAPLPTMKAPGGAFAKTQSERPDAKRKRRARAERPAGRKRPAEPAARRGRTKGGPRLRSFSLSKASMYLYGSPATVSFRIDSRSALRTVKLKLVPAAGGKATTLDLGPRQRGVTQRVALSVGQAGAVAQGRYRLRLGARDTRGRALRRGAGISSAAELSIWAHRFPLAGSFTYGQGGSRFGAGREGHRHQGQDLAAAEGVPVLAPRGGTVENVAYQAGGAGYYVVLDGDGEDRDYVFMHLRAGSTLVRKGQHVRTGQRLAQVGNTGGSSGPHLHFEVWTGGGWYTGGKPVDPLPLLRSWDR